MTTLTLLKKAAGALTLAAMLTATLSACGFHLRGSDGAYTLPFATVFITLPEASPLASNLKRNISSGGETEIAATRDSADAVIDVIRDPETTRGKTILSLASNGRVSEYLLSYTVIFRVLDREENELLGPTTITLTRPIDFNSSQLLAKETEEAGLYRDMRNDLVQQMIRRIAAIKLTKPGMSVAPGVALPLAAPQK